MIQHTRTCPGIETGLILVSYVAAGKVPYNVITHVPRSSDPGIRHPYIAKMLVHGEDDFVSCNREGPLTGLYRQC